MSRFAELHCGSVASRCSLQKLSNVLLLKLRRKRQPIKSYASTSSSQSNRVLVCPGREIYVMVNVVVVGRVSDTPTGKLQRTPPCGRCVRLLTEQCWGKCPGWLFIQQPHVAVIVHRLVLSDSKYPDQGAIHLPVRYIWVSVRSADKQQEMALLEYLTRSFSWTVKLLCDYISIIIY